MPLHLIRDVLDNRLVDRDGNPLGRVDGLVLQVRPGEQPRLTHIESGFTTLARRLHPRLGHWVRLLGLRFGLRRGRPLRLRWSDVSKVELDVNISVRLRDTDAVIYEDWIRKNVTRRLPLSR